MKEKVTLMHMIKERRSESERMEKYLRRSIAAFILRVLTQIHARIRNSRHHLSTSATG